MVDRADLSNRLRSIVAADRIEALRHNADLSGTFCVFASLYEISHILHGTVIPRIEKTWEDYRKIVGKENGNVSPGEFFKTLIPYCHYLNLEIKRILVNPSAFDKFDIPDDLSSRTFSVTGEQQVKEPSMRILLKKKEEGSYKAHAESSNGSHKSESRIRGLEDNGWQHCMVIEFEKTD